MSITNYSELQTAVGKWLQRSDLTSMIPDFIKLAEANFNRSLRLGGQLVREDLTVSARWTDLSGLTYTCLDIRTVKITAGGKSFSLQFMAPETSHTYYTAGTPKFYTRVGDELGVFPSPDGSYTLEVEYWRDIPDLATNSTNFLLTKAPDLYLYRSVLEGAQYLHNVELVARIDPMVQRAMQEVRSDDNRRQFGGSALTIKAA